MVKAAVEEAVQLWRWKRIEQAFPQLANGDGRLGWGGEMRPIWAALSTKTKAGRWDSGHKAAFKSTFIGRQWTQARRKAAGLSEHNKCVL